MRLWHWQTAAYHRIRNREADEIGAPGPDAVFFEDPDRLKVEVVVRDDE